MIRDDVQRDHNSKQEITD